MSNHRPFAQLRAGGLAFHPMRDLVNMFPRLIRGTAASLARHGWPGNGFRRVAAEKGLTQDDLASGPVALTRFMNEAMSGRHQSYQDAWVGAGLDRVPDLVRQAMFAHLGAVVVQTYFDWARPANPAGYRPPGSDEATEAMDRAAWALEADLPHVAERRRAEVERAADAGDE